MRKDNWDNDAKATAQELMAVEADLSNLFRSEQMLVLRKKIAIGHFQVSFGQLVTKFQSLKGMAVALSPQQRAVLHWAAVLANEAQSLYQKSSRFLGQKMWLLLIKTRLTGSTSAQGSLLVEDQDLLELAIRQKQLHQTERVLKDQLANVIAVQMSLRQTYDRELAIQMNIEAAGSLQSELGNGVNAAGDNPSYRALQTFIQRLFAKSRSNSRRNAEFSSIGKAIMQSTNAVVSACRSLIVGTAAAAAPADGLTAIAAALADIAVLERRLQELSQAELAASPPEARPIFLKKASTRGTTERYQDFS